MPSRPGEQADFQSLVVKSRVRLPFKLSLLALCAGLFGFSSLSHAQSSPPAAPSHALTRAGTSITNRASGSYLDSGTGFSSTLQSNPVDAVVQPLEAATLQPNQTIQNPGGAPFTLAHRLENVGNTQSQFKISAQNQPGDDYDVSNLKVFCDLNDNGIADANEPEMGALSPAVPAGTSISLVITGLVPANAVAQTSAKIELTAVSAAQGARAVNNDVIIMSSKVSLQIIKSASVQNAKPNDLVTYKVTAFNRGSVLPTPIQVSVDGAPRSLVLVRDFIPLNTGLNSVQPSGAGLILYHQGGSPRGVYVTKAPEILETVDEIALATSHFDPQTTVQLVFTALFHRNVSGDVRNTAQLLYAENGTDQTLNSNEVRVMVPRIPASLAYFTSADFNKIAPTTGLGDKLFIQADAAFENKDFNVRETIRITIRSADTGDFITVDALESFPNSGLFQVITTPLKLSDAPPQVNNEIETHAGDHLSSSYVSQGETVSTDILVDPFGVVYDSRSNAPVPGVRVTLIDIAGRGNGGHPGQSAVVLNLDGTSAPNSVITTADGRFRFPAVGESTYRLQIEAPAGFVFPSKIPAALQPTGRIIDVSGSYGNNFDVTVAGGPVQVDVPLDAPISQSGLFVEKIASRTEVEIGDFVDYEIRVKNTTANALTRVVLTDHLPTGFVFQEKTARLGGAAVTGKRGAGRSISFDLGDLAPGKEARLTYRVLVGVDTKIGRNTNRAAGTGVGTAGAVASNEATASVEVRGGVFDEKGIILGRIFVDLNRDGQWQEGEPGIPNVKIWIEDGTFILTDEDGKYSIYGLEARTHIVKVDATTLPADVKLQVLSSRYGKGGQSYLIDLKKGELHKVNFATQDATPEILAELKARRLLVAHSEDESFASLRTTLTPDGAVIAPGDTRALPASGLIQGGVATGAISDAATGLVVRPPALQSNSSAFGGRVFAPNAGENGGVGAGLGTSNGAGLPATQNALPLNSDNSNLPTSPAARVPLVDLEKELPNLDGEIGFVDLKNGDTLPLAQANVRVKGSVGSTFMLQVNGVEVPTSRVGLKASNANTTAWEYVGVKMQIGSNDLTLEQFDSFGISRGKIALQVLAPGDMAKVEISTPEKNTFADGRSLLRVGVRLVDAKGTVVSARTALTLESTVGQWQVADLNPNEPGVQVFLEGGRAEFLLLAPIQPGNGAVRVSSGVLEGSANIAFVPELRPLFVSGVATAKVGFGFAARGASEVRTQDIFENEDNARAALFVKGRILGKDLLTLRYDSQKRVDDRLFRDIQPDAFYPIYGDAAARGFDAQSTGKLYVRVDDQKSYLLYGDYTTSSLSAARSLGNYNRSFTGLKIHQEAGRLTANAYASQDNQRQVVDEIRGNGTSGRYLLRAGDIRPQSEKVEIIVRDRNQPGVVLSVTPQTRFLDYSFDGFSQGIIFRAPVPSVDANLNPVFVRVSYEVEQGGPTFLSAGGDAQLQVSNQLEIGASYATDRNPQQPYSLKSVNATYRFAPGTVLVGEWAQSDGSSGGFGFGSGDLTVGGAVVDGGNKGSDQSGTAQRLELLHEGRKLAARLFVGRSEAGFENPASLLSQGREEASFKATYKLSGDTRLVAEAIRTKDGATGGDSATRTGAQVSLSRSLGHDVQVEIGVRKVKDDGVGLQSGEKQPADFTSLRAKISAPVPGVPKAHGFLEYERAVQGDGQVLAVGGDVQIANRGRFYLRHELLSSLSGRYGLNDTSDQQTTLFGIDSDYMKNGRVFSEYRVGGGISGRDAQASIGLRNSFTLSRGVRLNTTFERIKDLGGTANNSTLAATGALEYTRSPNFKGTARLEVRGGSNDAILASLGAAYKVSPSLTFLGKGVISRLSSGNGDGAVGVGALPTLGLDLTGQNQRRLVLGLAYRSTKNDDLQALLKYEYRDEDGSFSTRFRNQSQTVSANVNYQASRKWNLSGRYALKSGSDQSNELSSREILQLLAGRATYDIGRRTELSLLSSFFSGGGASQLGAGAEIGFRLTSQVRLSAGYLFGHFHSEDSLDTPRNSSGFYLRFGYEFADTLGGVNP